MNVRRAIAALVCLALPLLGGQARAAEIKAFSTNAFKGVLQELGPQFEKATENKIVFTFAPTAALKTLIEQGAAFDVAVLTLPATKALTTAGKIVGTSRITVARAGMGVGVRAGAVKPDVSTVDAFKRAMMNAKTIGFNGRGASRAGFEALFKKLGLAEALAPKIKLLKTGAPEGVAKSEVEIGLGPISEFLPTPGVVLAGALPSAIQSYLVLIAGISAQDKDPAPASAFIKFLATPAATAVIKGKGMEPG